MKISQEIITQIREANPIEVIIGSYISLKKAGKNYKATCPFHPEKTPSFFVAPEKGIYHCFGCGKSGNVFTFIMEYNNITFSDAVKLLGEKAGIKIEFTGTETEYENLYKTNKFAAELYHSILLNNKESPAWKWIKNRQLQDSTIEKFMLGYAPAESKLIEKAKTSGITIKDLQAVGLINNGRETFKNKIIFPIKNRWGKVLGFGTRVLDNSEPKYINSMESPVFKKGNILYGLYEADRFIKDEIILVEGYMDLITLQQAEINNVVASMGTSLTPAQARLLKLYTNRVFVLYDGDESGRKAAERAIDILLAASLDVYLFTLPEDEDPDSFIKKGSKLSLLQAQGFAEYAESKFKKCLTVEEKSVFIKGFQQTLSKIPEDVKRDLWATEIAKKFNINKELLLSTTIPTPRKIEKQPSQKSIENLEAELLGLAASSPKVCELLSKNVFEISTDELKPLFKMVYEGIKYAELLSQVSNEQILNSLVRSGLLMETSEENIEKIALDYINKINKVRKNIRKNELIKEMKSVKIGTVSEDREREYQQLVNP